MIAVGMLVIAFVLFFVFLARRPILVLPACLIAWLIGIVCTVAAYTRGSVCSLKLAHVGTVLIIVDFLLTTLLPTI